MTLPKVTTLIGIAGLIILAIMIWRNVVPVAKAVLTGQEAERHQAIESSMRTREELYISTAVPPRELLDKHDREARRLKAQSRLSNEEPLHLPESDYMYASQTVNTKADCQAIMKNLGRERNVQLKVNSNSAYRKEAWKLCAPGKNRIEISRN
jgi:hypothetical protein